MGAQSRGTQLTIGENWKLSEGSNLSWELKGKHELARHLWVQSWEKAQHIQKLREVYRELEFGGR